MPSLREYKVALKGATYAFMAGAHAVTQTVWQKQSERNTGSKRETSYEELNAFLKDLYKSSELGPELAEILNEEGLYPFAEEWPVEGLSELLSLVKPPQLNEEDAYASPDLFRFKKGFKKALMTQARNRYALFDEETEVDRSHIDHWFSLVLNSAFYAGAVIAARQAGEGTEDFYAAMNELEEESEPWTRYDQVSKLFDIESARREESTEYGYGDSSSDRDGDEDESDPELDF